MADIINALTWTDYIGTIGALMALIAYFATQMRYLNSEDFLFPMLNLVGAMLISFSLYFNFNFPSAMIEFFWMLISIVGLVQYFRSKRKNRNNNTKH